MSMITPSLQFKILIKLYNKILKKNPFFKDNYKDIERILEKIEIQYYPPEFTIMKQYDTSIESRCL